MLNTVTPLTSIVHTLGGIATLSDLLSLTESQINSMTYVEVSTNSLTNLPLGNKAKIRALIAYQSHWCHQNENPEITWTEHMQDDFDNFRICIYNPNEPVCVYSSHGTQTANISSTSSPGKPLTSKADNFKKGVKRDKSHYMDFKNE